MGSVRQVASKPTGPRLGVRLTPWAFLIIPLIFYAIFFLVPLLQSVVISLTVASSATTPFVWITVPKMAKLG